MIPSSTKWGTCQCCTVRCILSAMTIMEATDGKYRPITVGDRLRIAREAAELDKETFAALTGISRHTVQRYERDEVRMKDYVVKQWALATGFSYAWITTGVAPTPPTDTGTLTARDRRPQPVDLRRRHPAPVAITTPDTAAA